MPLPDPGSKGMKGLLIAGAVISTISYCLYVSGLFLTTWSVPTEPNNANGGLGLYTYCLNTNYFINDTILPLLNITDVQTGCLYVDASCRVTVGYVVTTPASGGFYTYFSYNIFDPQPLRPDDTLYHLIKVFPAGGSCSGYVAARIFGTLATACALVALLSAPWGCCAPYQRRSAGGTGTGCVLCAVICGIVSVSVWAGSVINWQTSEYGSGLWCMVSALIIGALSIPCFSAFTLVGTEAPEVEKFVLWSPGAGKATASISLTAG